MRRESPAAVHASAADIADVQAALQPGEDALTPGAALLALGRRHGSGRGEEVADALLLEMARAAAPWLGGSRTYHRWTTFAGGPFDPVAADAGDRDVETPTGAPVVTWIGVSAQRAAVAAALAHHTSATAIGLDAFSLIPGVKLARGAASAGARRFLEHLPEAVHAARTGSGVVELMAGDGSDVPAGMRSGDVVIRWPVHRDLWRDSHLDESPPVAVGRAADLRPPTQDYDHVVYLRPHAGGLQVVAEELRT